MTITLLNEIESNPFIHDLLEKTTFQNDSVPLLIRSSSILILNFLSRYQKIYPLVLLQEAL